VRTRKAAGRPARAYRQEGQRCFSTVFAAGKRIESEAYEKVWGEPHSNQRRK